MKPQTKLQMTKPPPIPLAAIDIGSNAIRLVVGELDHHGDIRILKKFREPVRLGQDVFHSGQISKKTTLRALETFSGFREILKQYGVEHVRAVATSALREAQNRTEFVQEVKSATGLSIQIIDGLQEGRLIYEAVAVRVDIHDKNALLIDIGGGSVELTLSTKGSIRATQSFPLGTVRLLGQLEEQGLKEKHFSKLIEDKFEPVRTFLRDSCRNRQIDVCIGTGGNFECLGKLRVALLNRNSIYSMTREELTKLSDHLLTMTTKERMQFLRLRPDRADVIVPAALVAQAVMDYVGVDILLVPDVGLREGILADLSRSIVRD